MTFPREQSRVMPRLRRGVTLIELLISTSIMAMLIGALVAMASAVQQETEYSSGYGEATQHARVVLNRIRATVGAATASEQFPGAIVLVETVSGSTFPDTLVVWRPTSGAAANPTGLPRVKELVVYRPNPSAPNELLEVRQPANNNSAPAVASTSQWRTLVDQMVADSAAEKVVMTDLVRTAKIGTQTRACLRFAAILTPSAAQWTQYKAGTRAWNQLDWPLNIFGRETGIRQVWVRTEMQLAPGREAIVNPSEAMPAMPYFGSATVYYAIKK